MIPIATALRQSLKQGYGPALLRQDLLAAFVVSLVALPLSMALAIAVGLPPQHGLYTAILAGIAVALLGGSLHQVTGPTAAFVVILAPIVTDFGLRGIIWCQLIAGLVLILFGIARLGRLINYVPYPVTTGFTAGIAVVLATIACKDFLGLPVETLPGDFVAKLGTLLYHLHETRLAALATGLLTLLLIIFGSRWKVARYLPSPILGIAAGTLLGYLLQAQGLELATIGSSFTYLLPGGDSAPGIPPYLPSLSWPGSDDPLYMLPTFGEFQAYLAPALTVAALAALESLLSATIADSMASTKHHPNAELTALGIGNIVSGLGGGIPATGAIARTATNITSGARTPLAAVFHALLLLLYIAFLAPLMAHIPMSCLSALLLVTAWRMSHIRQFVHTVRIAPRSDKAVLLVCFALTVFIDMVAGVTVGLMLACFLFMKRIIELTQIRLEAHTPDDPLPSLAESLPADTMIYHVDGPLFFGTVEKAYDQNPTLKDTVRHLIIDMERVPLIDMTGLVALESLLMTVAVPGREIFLCGSRDITRRVREQLMHLPDAAPLLPRIHAVATVNEALNLIAR